jgi:hypothetical protein
MKHGFMLIELIIATLIASMVAGILLTALNQSSRFQMFIDDTVDMSMRIGVVANQLEKDLMGAFIPVQAELTEKKEEEAQDEEAEGAEQTIIQAPDEKKSEKQPDEKKTAKKEKQKPLEKIFYATNKEGNVDLLTFITNNPLVVYVGKDVGVVKPRIVRVQYSLKPEADTEDSYILQRQESNELDLNQWKNIRSYEVIGGIKSFSATYTARIESSSAKASEDSRKASESKEKIKYEYKTLKDWVSERKKEGEKEQEFPRIPYNIEFKMELWNKQNTREKEFTVVCEIPINFMSQKKSEPAKTPPKQQSSSAKASEDKPGGKQEIAQNSKDKTAEQKKFNAIESLTHSLENLTKMFGQI